MYINGVFVQKNIVAALEWFEKAANHGHIISLFYIANIYLYGGEDIEPNPSYAIDCYEKAANMGDTTSMFQLAIIYLEENFVPQDLPKAIFWLKKAAENGSEEAMFKLADMYTYGVGVEFSFESAENLYKHCLELGDIDALYALARLYETTGNYESAFFYYKKSSESDSELRHISEHNLGVMYATSNFVGQDFSEALRWLECSGAGGYVPAFYTMGNIYRFHRNSKRRLFIVI